MAVIYPNWKDWRYSIAGINELAVIVKTTHHEYKNHYRQL